MIHSSKTLLINLLFIGIIGTIIGGYVGFITGSEHSYKKGHSNGYDKGYADGIEYIKNGQKMIQDVIKRDKAVKTQKKNVEWQTVTMNVSAYCSCKKCCEQWAKIPVSSGKRKTASGHTVKVGDKFVAAPRSYSFGTEMIIKGYAGGKIVKVEDVGGAIKGNKLDLYFDKHQDALNWGRKNVEVKVKIK